MWFFSQGLILEIIQVIVMPWELAIHRSCRFIVSPWISPAWIRTFLYKSFKLMVLPWISWPWNSFVWHFNFLGSLALPFTEFAGSWCPHEFLLRELELFCTKVSSSWFYHEFLDHEFLLCGISSFRGCWHSQKSQVHGFPMNFLCVN